MAKKQELYKFAVYNKRSCEGDGGGDGFARKLAFASRFASR
jgi:hypothetical protein